MSNIPPAGAAPPPGLAPSAPAVLPTAPGGGSGLALGGARTMHSNSATAVTGNKSSMTAPKVGTDGKPLKKKIRRKKPGTARPSSRSGSTNSAASTATVWNAAKLAQAELAQLKAQENARRSDPLWYEKEDCLASIANETAMAVSSSSSSLSVLPEQVELVEAALRNNYLTRVDVTPQAFACLLEQARRHALDILADAQDYAYAANRHDVTSADMLLATELRADGGDFLSDVATMQPKIGNLAHQLNMAPLPPIPVNVYSGIALPHKHHQLTSRTFDVVSGARVQQKMVAVAPTLPVPVGADKKGNLERSEIGKNNGDNNSNKIAYGAKRGQQIQIQMAKRVTEREQRPQSQPTPMVGVVPTSTTQPTTTTSSTPVPNAMISTGAPPQQIAVPPATAPNPTAVTAAPVSAADPTAATAAPVSAADPTAATAAPVSATDPTAATAAPVSATDPTAATAAPVSAAANQSIPQPSSSPQGSGTTPVPMEADPVP